MGKTSKKTSGKASCKVSSKKTAKASTKASCKASTKGLYDKIDKLKKQLDARRKEIEKLNLQRKSAAAATNAFYDIMKSKGFSGRKDPIKQIKK